VTTDGGDIHASSAGLLWLCRDHDEIRDMARLLVSLCRQGARRPVVESCATLLRERIEEHERDEETFLHGRMMRSAQEGEQDAGISAEIRKVLRWHDRIDSDLFALTKALEAAIDGGLEKVGDAADRLGRELQRHFDYEERVFYPLADQLLGEREEISLRDELRAALLVRLDHMAREHPHHGWRDDADEEPKEA
jgi:hemerythrin-like domain-containing protein